LKKTASKKTGSKKTAIKKMSPKKTTPNKVSSKKKTAPNKKTSPKKTAPKKPAPKKAALKKKIATKRAAKDPKRARLDASSDLANLLTTSAGVLDIFAASGSRPLPMEVGLEDTFEDAPKNVCNQLDLLLGASSTSASVLDIIAASGSRTLPEEAFAGNNFAEEEAAIFLEEITSPGAEGGLSIANHPYQGPSAGFLGDDQSSLVAAQEATSGIRPRKAYLSPALIWLEEEGLPTAEMEVKSLGGEMDKEAAMRRVMEKWKRMSVEEKAAWRRRALERANSNQK